MSKHKLLILKYIFLIIVFSFSFIPNLLAQDYSVRKKSKLSKIVKETSGLLYFENRLITHNDSGYSPYLYEIDTITGGVSRTVLIENATNIDWEDIAQDSTYLYVADIGNNSGTRRKLKIYRVLKDDFLNKTEVTADIIEFFYKDQIDFTSKTFENDWDAEALVVWDDKLFIFSKNWKDQRLKLYVIPKTPGTYSASIASEYNLQGLLTGATIASDKTLFLLGYSKFLVPFLVVINAVDFKDNYDLFANSTIQKIPRILPFLNQTEGICIVKQENSQYHLFISKEELFILPWLFPAKLRSLDVKIDTSD